MNNAYKTGIGFGLTSGIITTLGLMIGLYSGTHSKIAVIGGIITIAIADALSDSLGIHISQESSGASIKKVWQSTILTFITKFFVAISFIMPFLFLTLEDAVFISVVYGIGLLGLFSYYIAVKRKEKPFKVILEHLTLAFLTIIITYLVGTWVSNFFS